jgi:hypothetical protein
MATAAVTNFHGMLASRVFLGIAESTVSPSLMLITAQWYTKSEQAPRFALWVRLQRSTSLNPFRLNFTSIVPQELVKFLEAYLVSLSRPCRRTIQSVVGALCS